MIAVLTPALYALGPYALLLVMGVAFVETALLLGFFLPGDSMLFTTGVLVAAGVVPLPLWLVVVAVAVCAIAGDAVGYVVGGRLGARLLAEQQPRPRIRRHAVTATAFFERHGPRAVVLARFLPLVRTFTPVVAGAVHMPRARFTAFNVLGASLWSGLILSVGYLLGGVPFVANHVELLTVTVVAVTLLPAALTLARRRSPSPTVAGDADKARALADTSAAL